MRQHSAIVPIGAERPREKLRDTVPGDGHTTSDRPHLSAAKIIEHHNAIWADFLSPVSAAKVCACDEAVIAPAGSAAAT
jgi:hypothetical protein